MSAAAAGSPEPTRAPFAEATPAAIRDALLPEDAVVFDRQWREAMRRATERLDLAEVHEVLESWRRVAWMTQLRGHAGYREMLVSAEHRLRTGERGAGSMPWSQLKVELGLSD
jgi:hypothetical protein